MGISTVALVQYEIIFITCLLTCTLYSTPGKQAMQMGCEIYTAYTTVYTVNVYILSIPLKQISK